ncbi:MAG: PEP-CTERM sorting domain-containing protein [Terriglobia bacterium]
MRLDKQSEKILVVDDERTIRTPVKAFLDRKDPDSGGGVPVPEPSTVLLLASGLIGGAARWKSRRDTADTCHKEVP